MKRRNITAAVVLLLVSFGYGYLTSGLPDRTLPDTPDPAFMPWINTFLLAGLSLFLLIRALGKEQARLADRDGEPADGRKGPMGAVLFLAAFVCYIVLLPWLGFVLASIPFFAAIMYLFGERRSAWLAIGAIAGPLILYLIFRHGFNVVLPRGLLGTLIG